MALRQLSSSYSVNIVGHILGAWQRITQSLCFIYMVGKYHLFQISMHQITSDSKSVVGIQPYDSGVVIVHQVDEFICTWLTENFVA